MKGGDLHRLGEALVSASVDADSTDDLAHEHREIHDKFKRDRDAESAYFRMGFLAARAIGRARQFEEVPR
jgi:hypothetical protein